MKLYFHRYKYFPYERELALREVASLLGDNTLKELSDGVEFVGNPPAKDAGRLVYFSKINSGKDFTDTTQAQLEQAANSKSKRQATRYSVHGLHEYKGKFNPQVAKAILNIFGVKAGQWVFDPFSGSGTSLVEATQ